MKRLSRDEMKKVMGGNETPPKKCGTCHSGDSAGTTLTCYRDAADLICVQPSQCSITCASS